MAQQLPLLVSRIQHAAKSSVQQSVITYMQRLREQINARKLFVLNEDLLHCDVKTDHLYPKSVLPLFDAFISAAEVQLLDYPFDKFTSDCNKLVSDYLGQYYERQENWDSLNDKYLYTVYRLQMVNEYLNQLMDTLITEKQTDKTKLLSQIYYLQEYLHNKRFSLVYQPDFSRQAQSSQGHGQSGVGGLTDPLMYAQNKQYLERISQLTSYLYNMQTQMRQLEQENVNRTQNSYRQNDDIKALTDKIDAYKQREDEFQRQEQFIGVIQNYLEQKDVLLEGQKIQISEMAVQIRQLEDRIHYLDQCTGEDTEELRHELDAKNRRLHDLEEQVYYLRDMLKHTREYKDNIYNEYKSLKDKNLYLQDQNQCSSRTEEQYKYVVEERDKEIQHLYDMVAQLQQKANEATANSVKSFRTMSSISPHSYQKSSLRPSVEDKECYYEEFVVGERLEAVQLDNFSRAQANKEDVYRALYQNNYKLYYQNISQNGNQDGDIADNTAESTTAQSAFRSSRGYTQYSQPEPDSEIASRNDGDPDRTRALQISAGGSSAGEKQRISRYQYLVDQGRIIQTYYEVLFDSISPQRRQLGELYELMIQQQGRLDDLYRSQLMDKKILEQNMQKYNSIINYYKQLLKEITKQDQEALYSAEDQLKRILNRENKQTQTELYGTQSITAPDTGKYKERTVARRDNGYHTTASRNNGQRGSKQLVNTMISSSHGSTDGGTSALVLSQADTHPAATNSRYQRRYRSVMGDNAALYGNESFSESSNVYPKTRPQSSAANSRSVVKMKLKYPQEQGGSKVRKYHEEWSKNHALQVVNEILAKRGMRPIGGYDVTSIEDVYQQLERRKNQYTTFFMQQKCLYKPYQPQTVTTVDMNSLFKNTVEDDTMIITNEYFRHAYTLVNNRLIESDKDKGPRPTVKQIVRSGRRTSRQARAPDTSRQPAVPVRQGINPSQNMLVLSGGEIAHPYYK